MNGNSVSLVGNLTRDPELRYTPAGTAVAKFGIAVNRRYNDSNGKAVETTDFMDVTAWRDQAEHVAQLPVGTRVVVLGRFQQDRWENDEGEKRNKVYVVADEVAASLRFATVSVTKSTKGSASWEASSPPEEHEPMPEAETVVAGAGKGKKGAGS